MNAMATSQRAGGKSKDEEGETSACVVDGHLRSTNGQEPKQNRERLGSSHLAKKWTNLCVDDATLLCAFLPSTARR
jgi:hypothetical protein